MPKTDSHPESALSPREHRVTMQDIEYLGEKLETIVNSVKRVIFQPKGDKPAPEFNLAQLAALCAKTPDQMSRLLAKDAGTAPPSAPDLANDGHKKRVFTLAEVRSWVQRVGPALGRPSGRKGAVLTVANFKGGVGKTVVSMSLAQGLALKGYKVLCIDYDPQGSLTSLFGLTPTDIGENETVLPLMLPRSSPAASDTLQASIRSTYFDGIDLIPGNHGLLSGEFYLPLRQMNSTAPDSPEKHFEFYNVLNDALDRGLRQEYDFIVCDTPPSLSYMVMTCLWASDALLLPLPAEGLDFQSSAQFWSMLSALASGTRGQESKEFAWVGAVPSKVDHTKMHTKEILSWMKTGYEGKLLSTEIPETAAVRVGGVRSETVYDISKYVGSQKTLLRAREAYDKLVDEVDFLTRRNFWNTVSTTEVR